MAEEWVEVGHVVTAVSLTINTQKPGWKVDQEDQLRFLAFHDRVSHRLEMIIAHSNRLRADSRAKAAAAPHLEMTSKESMFWG